MSDDLLKLAARCEAATGSDRELDRDIELAFPYEDAKHLQFGLPQYTGSINLAMALVPEGWEYSFMNGNGYDEATLTNHTLERTAWSSGNSLALAIVAAALRARARSAA